MNKIKLIAALLVSFGLTVSSNVIAGSADGPVAITKGVSSVRVMHDGRAFKIERNQDNKNTINPDFAKTSRACPPFCIQPSQLAPGIETIAENEMLDYLSRMAKGDESILVIDSRTPNWVKKGNIPGSINLQWNK